MAANGLFTFEDLYAGQSPPYHRRLLPEISSPITRNSFLSIWDKPLTTTTSHIARLISSNEVEASSQLNKLADVIPFTYFYWILMVLAILLALTLIIVFICYCRTFIKNYRTRRGSLTSFYRRRTVNPHLNAPNIYQPTAKVVPPPVQPSPRTSQTPACPSKSLKCLDDQLYRRDSDPISSPHIARHDIFLKEPLSTFTSSTPNSSSMLHSRLSARSSDLPPKLEQLYESQHASIALHDEPKNDSLIIDIN